MARLDGGRPLSLHACLEEIGMELVCLAEEPKPVQSLELYRIGRDLIQASRRARGSKEVAS